MPALPLAIFFELFWLDLFHVGTYVPPNGVFSLLAMLFLAGRLHIADAPDLAFPMALSLPLAILGARLETWQRKLDTLGYNRVIDAGSSYALLSAATSRAVLSSISQIFLFSFLAFTAGTAVFYLLIWMFRLFLPDLPASSAPTWPVLWLIASGGGILALRIRWAFATFWAGLAILLASLFI